MIRDYTREINTIFDLIVKTRFDLIYFNQPNWDMCLDGKLHCGYGACWGFPDETFGIGTPEVMLPYLTRFDHFPDMFNPDSKSVIPGSVRDLCPSNPELDPQ